MTTAIAHPNIALVKYWGKQDKPGNVPATPNLSITLSNLTTTTTIQTLDSNAGQDEIFLNGVHVDDQKIAQFLSAFRSSFNFEPVKISSDNNFPTGAGLASSASGFAALVVALNEHFKLTLDREMLSEWARLGSASAARSLFGGYVALVPPLWQAQPLASESHWPLQVVVGISSQATKAVSSTQGMNLSRASSPYYSSWVRDAGDDFAEATDAINARDFAKLAHIAELSCLKMHSVMLTTTPTLSYWNSTTLTAMDAIRELRAQGTEVFFTVDAGPQIKAVCNPEHTETVEKVLAELPGMLSTVVCDLGPGAQIQA